MFLPVSLLSMIFAPLIRDQAILDTWQLTLVTLDLLLYRSLHRVDTYLWLGLRVGMFVQMCPSNSAVIVFIQGLCSLFVSNLLELFDVCCSFFVCFSRLVGVCVDSGKVCSSYYGFDTELTQSRRWKIGNQWENAFSFLNFSVCWTVNVLSMT